jgi:hypothetical protein
VELRLKFGLKLRVKIQVKGGNSRLKFEYEISIHKIRWSARQRQHPASIRITIKIRNQSQIGQVKSSQVQVKSSQVKSKSGSQSQVKESEVKSSPSPSSQVQVPAGSTAVCRIRRDQDLLHCSLQDQVCRIAGQKSGVCSQDQKSGSRSESSLLQSSPQGQKSDPVRSEGSSHSQNQVRSGSYLLPFTTFTVLKQNGVWWRSVI